MCYAYKPARASSDTLPGIRIPGHMIPDTVDGFCYAKDAVPVMLAGGEARSMRWDLIPRGYLRNENLPLTEILRKKNSRALNPATGKSWGFSSYNARIETVETLPTFKDAWADRNRGVIPVEAFRERPNRDDAPAEARGREYEITLDKPCYLAALFDTWTSKTGESIESCTVITGPSDDIPALQNIWHERTPILLSEEDCKIWLDPATPPNAAMALLRAAKVPNMTVHEVPKVAKVPKTKKEKKEKPPKEKPKKNEGQTTLDLFGV